jgi:hypothetical protein
LPCGHWPHAAGEPRVPSATGTRPGRGGRGRLAPPEGGLRAVQQEVLRSFAADGHPPVPSALAETAARYGTTAEWVLARLHADDFLRLDSRGEILAAYPFSAIPTPHVVRIAAGPAVHAMCAIDALGVAPMLDAAVTIASADPRTAEPVLITVRPDGAAARWQPSAGVVFSGQRMPTGPGGACAASAEVCCAFMNFFASHASADAWADAHPEISGEVLRQAAALRLGKDIFGHLLGGS